MIFVIRNFGLIRLKNIGKYVRNVYFLLSFLRIRGKKKFVNFVRGNLSDYLNMFVGRRSINFYF